MGFSLLLYACITPPPGYINYSVIIAAGILFCIGALCVGVDIRGIIGDVIKLRQIDKKQFDEWAEKQTEETKIDD